MLRNTLDGIEALAAVARFGTVSEAAKWLRLTQSGVTKRLQALRRAVHFELLEPDGRRLKLTENALTLVERARPLLADLRALTEPPAAEGTASFSLAIADSIAVSWGPAVLAKAIAAAGNVEMHLHVERSALLIEHVRLGRYQIGLASDVSTHKDLIHYPIATEPMVLINSELRGRPTARAPLITIEPTSVTWRAIEPLLKAHHPQLLERRRITVESLNAAVQMVRAGFGDGLVPFGLLREMKLPKGAARVLAHVDRHVTLVTRKTVNQSQAFTRFRMALQVEAARVAGQRWAVS